MSGHDELKPGDVVRIGCSLCLVYMDEGQLCNVMLDYPDTTATSGVRKGGMSDRALREAASPALFNIRDLIDSVRDGT